VGRDVGRDEGREQAEWRDIVARLEIPASIDPSDAPWPDRENLSAKTQAATGTSSVQEADGELPDGAGEARDEHGGPGPADRGRVIRPAGSARSCDRTSEPSARDDDASSARTPGEASDPDQLTPVGPRDYGLDEPRDDDLDDADNRYIPPPQPPQPPQPKLDPVAKGAWIALFGGPGYLLLATLLSWQIAGWAALTAVMAFVTGFIVLVIRLGDGPSKRDGPDQGAVV
jgi:hypothetical protein